MASHIDHGHIHRGPSPPLPTPADPPPVTLVNPAGSSPFLFIGDHAGNVIPRSLGTMGLAEADLQRHIAWDIGIGGLGAALAQRMDAVFLRQTYSRLVIDCNRDPVAADAMPAVSDGTPVPANRDLDAAGRAARVDAIHRPYHAALAAELARRQEAGRAGGLIALHSFTPMLRGGTARPWQVGVLHDRGDTRLALALLGGLRADGRYVVGDNEPYRMDGIDHTVPRHAYPAELPYVELEIRQDLIATAAQQEAWAELLAGQIAAASRRTGLPA